MKFTTVIALAGLLASSPSWSAGGDAAAGQAKSAVCVACHSVDGNSVDPLYPKIAGQHAEYIARQLTLFKSGKRQNPIMLGIAMTLSDQDMLDLGAHFAAQTVNSAVMVLLFGANLVPEWAAFWLYFYWTVTVFFMAGLTIGNLNALALEPMGHIAGTAASVVTALATVLSVLVAAPIGLAFDGTPLPLMVGVFICSALAVPLMLALPRREG